MQQLTIVKIGGELIDDAAALTDFMDAFASIQGLKLLVHGGGKLASKMMSDLGHEVKMHKGRRITDAQSLDVITMVYAGKINKQLVAQLQKRNCNALGFTGADGNTIVATKRPIKEVDFGFVGDIEHVNTSVLKLLIESQVTPVFCAISHDENGSLFNTNADTIASELAIALSKDYHVQLYYCFDKAGVLKDVKDENSLVPLVTKSIADELIGQGYIVDGMLPKIHNCFYALENGVDTIHLGKLEMLKAADVAHTKIVL